MSKAIITFKSGAQTTVDLKSIATKRNHLGALIGINWEDGRDKLIRLNVESIDAIVWRD